MLKSIAVMLGGLAALAASALAVSPGLRTQVRSYWARIAGWTEEAREADPVGFATHAEKQLRLDLEALESTRRQLLPEIAEIVRKRRENEALRDHAQHLAEEFRVKYQLASSSGGFPVAFRGSEYTEEQVKSQVSMLLAERDGYERTMEKLQRVQKQAQAELEAMTVRINETQAQIVEVRAKTSILRANELSEEGKRLLAQVDHLLDGNAETIRANPVRTVRELLTAPAHQSERTASADRVDVFLAAGPMVEPDEPPQSDNPFEQVLPERAQAVEEPGFDGTPAAPETPEVEAAPGAVSDSGMPRKSKRRAARHAVTKPIFQQF
jgi:phage shock protein A